MATSRHHDEIDVPVKCCLHDFASRVASEEYSCDRNSIKLGRKGLVQVTLRLGDDAGGQILESDLISRLENTSRIVERRHYMKQNDLRMKAAR